MKQVRAIQTLVATGLLTVAVFLSVSCSALGPPTPTPSPPSPTPTFTPTPNPTPTPAAVAFWDMLLTLHDMPPGFEQEPIGDLDIFNEGLAGEKWPIRAAFMFLEPDHYQFVIGVTQLVQGRLDQVQFDAGVNRPQFMLQTVIQSMGLSGILEEDVLPSVDDIGDASAGVTVASEGTGEGLPMRLDLVAFRRDVVGAYVIVMYVDGENPVVEAGELARLFDERIIDVLLSSRQGEEGTPQTESATYARYSDADLGFSAEYPSGWEIDLRDNRNPRTGEALEGKIVRFVPPEGDRAKRRLISVLVLTTPPGVQLGPQDMPTDQWYIDYIRDWAEMMPVDIVGDPSIVELDGYKAAEVVTSGTDEYAGAVGRATFLVTEDRMFYVEASGDPGIQPEILRIYDHFMSTFDVVPLP